MSSILVTDYYSEKMEEIEVKLDKPKTPIENMEYYFKKYEKFKRGVLFIEKELKKIEIEIEKLSTQPVILIGEQVPLSLNNNRKKNDVHTQYKTYLGSNGFKILVGKGSVDNDYLTFKVASGNDIWLHVLSYSGSHVVIKKNNKKDIIDINTIYEAAHLAVLNSKAPNNDSVEVCYTYRKFVKKPPKSNPGAVIYTQEKRVYIKLDKNITDNLKSV
jgi:predicted ribosome quality control (RQC) complex YloA/Tae2 family protein